MVLAIMAILLALAIPVFGDFQERWILETTAWRLVSDLRLAQQIAITTGVNTRIDFRWTRATIASFTRGEDHGQASRGYLLCDEQFSAREGGA